MSHPDADGQPELNFEQELEQVERSLQELKQRYSQVEHDRAAQTQLQQRQDQLQQQWKRRGSPELKAELKRIQEQLDELEFNLESRLFTWGSLRESFWQIVRFGGLGIVVGWFLALAVLQDPKPIPPQTNPALQQPQ